MTVTIIKVTKGIIAIYIKFIIEPASLQKRKRKISQITRILNEDLKLFHKITFHIRPFVQDFVTNLKKRGEPKIMGKRKNSQGKEIITQIQTKRKRDPIRFSRVGALDFFVTHVELKLAFVGTTTRQILISLFLRRHLSVHICHVYIHLYCFGQRTTTIESRNQFQVRVISNGRVRVNSSCMFTTSLKLFSPLRFVSPTSRFFSLSM